MSGGNAAVRERLAALRESMGRQGVTACLFPTSDYHDSEYIGEHFKLREWFSGFTGSAGTLVVLQGEAGLWTDGRYFLQAARELEGSDVRLYPMDEPGVPSVEAFLADRLGPGDCLAFDGKLIGAAYGEKLTETLEARGVSVRWDGDPAEGLWPERPPLSCRPAWLLDLAYAGRTAGEKLAELRRTMTREGAEVHLLTTLDDVAWLFNLRGDDVEYNPVVLAYAAITEKEALLFLNEAVLSPAVRSGLEKDGVSFRPYQDVYAYAAGLAPGTAVLADKRKLNLALFYALKEKKVIDRPNPEILAKAVKNATEQRNLMEAHIKDGVAFTRFMYWLKNTVGREPVTEYSAAGYMDGCRREQRGFLGPSFCTISGYGENGAVVHYSPSPESSKPLEPKGLLLIDSGGHYYEGTTDMTRTIALGPLSVQEKKDFALVLRAMLALADIWFPEGCSGLQLDVLARAPFWKQGLNYRHGTGHGVGYLLNVHEGPNGFRYQPRQGEEPWVFVPGMVTSDEPGVYREGSHGVRLENLLLCVEKERNEFGRFLGFVPLTLAPIDLDAVDPAFLEPEDINRLDRYHRLVFEQLSPLLTAEERAWLKEYTRPVG
ncbi:MAG: aminopeptidase P family protein [Bacillota bacterium]|nr:aminopeptidase P family protein [Bacillota bacterium]